MSAYPFAEKNSEVIGSISLMAAANFSLTFKSTAMTATGCFAHLASRARNTFYEPFNRSSIINETAIFRSAQIFRCMLHRIVLSIVKAINR